MTQGGAKWFKVGRKEAVVDPRDVQVNMDASTLGVFVNTFTHSLDSKKRLTIPADWRELVGVPGKLFVLPGVNDKCLCVYPAREMARRLKRLGELSIADEKGRQFARTLASRSDLVPWDAQGRIRIKDDLLDFAGLASQVVLVGTFDGFELWSPEQWNAQVGTSEAENLKEAAKYVGF